MTRSDMPEGPGVSVVIRTYNHGRYILDAIRSVAAQTYKRFEIIVVDDGSTDDTRKIVGQSGIPLRYTYQSNQGRAVASNTGVMQSRYEWIALLDADDLWLEDKLQKQIDAIRAHDDIDVLVTNAAWFDDSGIVQDDYFGSMRLMHRWRTEDHDSLHIFRDRLFPLFIEENFVNNSSVLMRKRCVVDSGMYDEGNLRNEDRDMWLRLSKNCCFAYIDELLTRSRVHSLGDGLGSESTLRSRVLTFEKALLENDEWVVRYRGRLRKRLGRACFELGYHHFYHYALGPARRELARSVRLGHRDRRVVKYLLLSLLPVTVLTQARRLRRPRA